MGSVEEKRKVGELLKEKILATLVEPSYYTDVNETIKGRKCWRVSGHVFESMSKIFLAVASVLSFAAGVYDDKILSFVAGTLSTTSLACFQFSLYSIKMHKKNSYELNQLLDKLNIDTVPVFGSSNNGKESQEEQEMYEPCFMARESEPEVVAAPVEVLTKKNIIVEAHKIDIPKEEEERLIQNKKEEV